MLNPWLFHWCILRTTFTHHRNVASSEAKMLRVSISSFYDMLTVFLKCHQEFGGQWISIMRRNLIFWYHIIIRLLYLPVQSGVWLACIHAHDNQRILWRMFELDNCINFIYCTVQGTSMEWYFFPKQRGWSCNAMEKYWLNFVGLDMMWDYLRCTNQHLHCLCKV